MRKWWLMLMMVAVVALPALAGEQVKGRVLDQALTVGPLDAEDGVDGHPRAKAAITQFLALTEEQVAQWDALMVTLDEAVSPLEEQLRATEEQLKELLQSENPDPGAVGTLVLSGRTLREGIGTAVRAYVEGFEALLTPEQKGKLGAVRRAARLAPLLPAFGTFQLLGPAGR